MPIDGLKALIARAYVAATLGDLDQADALVAQARASGALAHDVACTAQVMLVEGVAAIYRNDAPRARERLLRVDLFGGQLGASELSALAKGWLALLEYNAARFEEAAGLLAPTVGGADPPTDRVRLRAATLLSLLCEYAGASDAAAQWLLAARLAASSMGIAGALSTVLFDQAVAAIDSYRIGRLRAALDAHKARELLLRVESALHYDAGAGVGALPALHRLALGMALNLCAEHARAAEELRRFTAATPDPHAAGWICAQAELAVAELALADGPLPAPIVACLQAALELPTDAGERAVLQNVLAEHCRRSGQAAQARAHAMQRQRELQEHAQQAERLRTGLAACGLLAVPSHWLQ